LSDFWQLTDLAAERTGGRVLYATDDFFAEKENLLKASAPVFIEEKYTDRGKWMDGWESRRRRPDAQGVLGHDWCLIRLGLPGVIRDVVVDTSFFRGNFPSHCSIEACAAEPDASVESLLQPETQWAELLPKSELKGDAQNHFPISSPWRFTHLRFHIFPDGGVARLRVHGEVIPDWRAVLAGRSEVDLLAVEQGGRALAASDLFYSHPRNLTMPGRGARMDDGWETKRRRPDAHGVLGHDWCVLHLGAEGVIRRVELDTAHFKGNYPDSCSMEVSRHTAAGEWDVAGAEWRELLPQTKLRADHVHFFEKELRDAGPATHVRLNIYPDGGVSRLRLFGVPTPEGRARQALRLLNTLPPAAAEATLRSCCCCVTWAEQVARARPFRDAQHLLETADLIWSSLGKERWLEAFRAHPRIGEHKAEAGQSAEARKWSEQEQSTAAQAGAWAKAALLEANRAYEARFGHIFLICATGKSGEEILAGLQQRMNNDPETELRIAAEEQRKVTRLRLEKWMNP
jgi:allantoicase